MANSLINTTRNSIDDSLAYFIKIAKQSIEILTKLENVFTSTSDSVQLNLQNESGQTRTFTIPTISSLNARTDKQNRDIKQLNSLIDKSNGLPTSNLRIKEKNKITALNSPNRFNFKPNWFLENFLSPLLYVTFDLSSKVDPNTRQIEVKRVIVKPNNNKKRIYFNNTYIGKNNIDHDLLIADLDKQGLSYTIDQSVLQLPPSFLKKRGYFDVVGITPGTPVQNTKYFLNTLQYDSLEGGVYQKKNLRLTDLIFKNNTIYEIVDINQTEESIKVALVSGFEAINIGANEITIASETQASSLLEVAVSFDEYQVVFIREVDPYFNVVNVGWSDGVGFYTNNLLTDTSDGLTSFKDFYTNYVTDYSILLLNQSIDTKIPISYAIKPKAPLLKKDNFKVVKINDHLLNTNDLSELSNRIEEKVRYTAKILAYDMELDKLYTAYEKLQLTRFIGVPQTPQETQLKQQQQAQIDDLKSTIDSIITKKEIDQTLLNSVIEQLKQYGKNRSTDNTPKYRVRGFWPIPDPQFDNRTGFQEVIQFFVSYRYLSITNATKNSTIQSINTALTASSKADQLPFIGNNNESRIGYFSPWTEIQTPIRKKVYDSTSGKFIWEVENVADADTVNINQLDIPITRGEIVEIRIRSVSEAGFPTSLVLSDWSDSVQITFPEDILDETDTDLLLSNLESEELTTQIKNSTEANALRITDMVDKILALTDRVKTLELQIKPLLPP